MSFLISVYGDITKEDREKLLKAKPGCKINIIPYNDIQLFDDALYNSDTLIFRPTEKDRLSFAAAYLAEWRVSKHLQETPVFMYSEEGDDLDIFLKSFAAYRANLPEEKNTEAKNWFIYPTKKVSDLFTVVHNVDEIIDKLKSTQGRLEEKQITKNIPESEFKGLKEKFCNAELYESYEKYCSSKDRQPGIFVPAFASGNSWVKFASQVGKIIAELGFGFINGGPDADGPMRNSALGAQEGRAKILAVYSLPVLKKYVLPEKIDCFKHISIILTATEGQRKQIMLDESVAVIALPGAIGTIAEIEDAIRLGKPVILIDDKSINNGNGYWKFYTDYLTIKGLIDKVTVVYCQDNLHDKISDVLTKHNILPRQQRCIIRKEEVAPVSTVCSTKDLAETTKVSSLNMFKKEIEIPNLPPSDNLLELKRT